jgi:hypothetical protein
VRRRERRPADASAQATHDDKESPMTPTGSARSRFLAAAAAFLSLAGAGCASTTDSGARDADSDFARPGIYAGIYGLHSFENFHTSGPGIHAGDSDLGAGVKFGYRLNPEFAVEAIAESVKGFEISRGNVENDLDLANFAVAGKYFFMHDRFQPYLLGGIGMARSDVRNFDLDDNDWFLRAGLGMDVYITPGFAVFGEANYNRMMSGSNDLHHIDLAVGLMVRF